MAYKNVQLPRLPLGWQDQPQLLERYWDEAMSAIERSLNAVLQLPIIQDALDSIDLKVAQVDRKVAEVDQRAEEARLAAEAAQQAADQAGVQTEAQRRETSLNQSYVTNFSGSLIVASSSGLVTIKEHDRVYGDSSLNPSVKVFGKSISSGATSGEVLRIFYIDPERDGGEVVYQFTKDPDAPPVQSGDTHSVGAVQIPETGERPGNGLRPPGYVEP